jgi:hypothetical protein
MSVVRCTVDVMARGLAGHIERLPSGSWRVKVYTGIDPLTGREIRLRRTCKTERAAQIELGKLLEQAVAERQPDRAVTVAQLLDQYVPDGHRYIHPAHLRVHHDGLRDIVEIRHPRIISHRPRFVPRADIQKYCCR